MMDQTSMHQNSKERLPSIQASSSRQDPRLSMSLKKSRSSGTETYSQRRGRNREATSAAWAYTKYAMLFFIAVLVTWVRDPSSSNPSFIFAKDSVFSDMVFVDRFPPR